MSSPESRKAGRRVLAYILAFFGVVIVANGIFIYAALKSWSGLETKDAYERGLAYNETLRAAEEQIAQGWTLDLSVEKASPGEGAVSALLRDASGVGIDGLAVTVRFVRPVAEGYDRTVALAPVGEGRYRADVALPMAGQWDARVLATGERGRLQAVKRLRL